MTLDEFFTTLAETVDSEWSGGWSVGQKPAVIRDKHGRCPLCAVANHLQPRFTAKSDGHGAIVALGAEWYPMMEIMGAADFSTASIQSLVTVEADRARFLELRGRLLSTLGLVETGP